MNCIKRAFLHDVRKAGKTLLLFSILLVIGILLLTCFPSGRAHKSQRSIYGSL